MIGGLGIGKIIVINGIIEVYFELYYIDLNKNDIFIVFVVFIGCVVRCMNEFIGLLSVIIYRYLGLNGDSDY